jgi:hypothetical protein
MGKDHSYVMCGVKVSSYDRRPARFTPQGQTSLDASRLPHAACCPAFSASRACYTMFYRWPKGKKAGATPCLRRLERHIKVQSMSNLDSINKIIAPFLVHGLCRDEAEVLQILAKDYVQRQVQRYAERVESFRVFYQTPVDQFAQQVVVLCRDGLAIPALGHLDVPEQIMRAEDDLEEWQAAEQYLAHWKVVEADLSHASTT